MLPVQNLPNPLQGRQINESVFAWSSVPNTETADHAQPAPVTGFALFACLILLLLMERLLIESNALNNFQWATLEAFLKNVTCSSIYGNTNPRLFQSQRSTRGGI